MSNVESVSYLSKDEAKDQFIDKNKEDIELRLSITNPMATRYRDNSHQT